jgi:hypothetical protein
MKEIRGIFAIFCFILFPAFLPAVQPVQQAHGLSLCQNVENLLMSDGFVPVKSNLIQNGSNVFPYNVEVHLPAPAAIKKNSSTEIRNTLIIAMTMENAWNFRNYTDTILKNVKQSQRDYNLIFLFSYGDLQTGTNGAPLYGTDIFAGSIDTPDDCSAVCISFTPEKTAVIIPGGGGDMTPSWLIQRLTDACTSHSIPYHLRGGSLGSLYRLGVLKADRRTAVFLQKGIPCAGLSLPENADSGAYAQCTADFLSAYSCSGTDNWDRHYIAFHAGNSFLWASEQFIVICFILVSFISLFFLSELSFLSSWRQHKIRHDVFRLWYVLPLTVILSAASFQVSQPFVQILYRFLKLSILFQFIVKVVIVFIIVTFLYHFIVHMQGVLEERAYAYLLTVVSVINIFIFSAVDISLFFPFTAEYIIIYLFRPFKKTNVLVTALIVMILPYGPYIGEIMNYADPSVFRKAVYSSFTGNILISFGFLPFLIQWLRIIARLNERWSFYNLSANSRRIRSAVSFTAGTAAVIIILFAGVSFISAYLNPKHKNQQEHVVRTIRAADDILAFSAKDRTFFDDTTRTISVNLGIEAESCIISVEGVSSNSVVYSDNEYVSDKAKHTDAFLVPVWPPVKMSVSYVADTSVASVITVTAYYPGGDESSSTMRTRKIIIPASKKQTENKI